MQKYLSTGLIFIDDPSVFSFGQLDEKCPSYAFFLRYRQFIIQIMKQGSSINEPLSKYYFKQIAHKCGCSMHQVHWEPAEKEENIYPK